MKEEMFVLVGEEGGGYMVPASGSLLDFVYRDTHHENSYWGRDKHGRPLDPALLVPVGDLDFWPEDPGVEIVEAVRWEEEPALWCRFVSLWAS